MSAPLYICRTEGIVAAAAATTAKTIIGVKAHANSGIALKKFALNMDGVTASEKPVLIELCYCTFGANSPGTNSTSTTPIQEAGRALAAGFTSGKTWTAEPTTISVLEDFDLDPNKGLFVYDFPLGDEPDTALGEGLVIRCTVPSGGAAVNFRAYMKVSRI